MLARTKARLERWAWALATFGLWPQKRGCSELDPRGGLGLRPVNHTFEVAEFLDKWNGRGDESSGLG